MPHRKQYRKDIGGWAILIGCYSLYLGITWLAFPTDTRAAGVEWINHSGIPIYGLTGNHVAYWWLLGGILAVVGGILSERRLFTNIAIVATVFFPSVVSVIFFGSWVDQSTKTGLISSGSYLFPAAVMLHAIWREAHNLKRGYIQVPESVVTGEMKVVD